MKCCDAFEKLYRYLDNDLEEISAEEIRRHLDDCRPCWDKFDFEKHLIARFKSSCCKERLPRTFRKRIQDLLKNY